MSHHLNVVIGALVLAACRGQLLSAESATPTLSPDQGLFVAGEPIDLTLALRNASDAPAHI